MNNKKILIENFISDYINNINIKNVYKNINIISKLFKKIGNKKISLLNFKIKLIESNIVSKKELYNIDKDVRYILNNIKKEILNKKLSILQMKNKLFSIINNTFNNELSNKLKITFFLITFIFLFFIIISSLFINILSVDILNTFFNFIFIISVFIFLLHSANINIKKKYDNFFVFLLDTFKNLFSPNFYKNFKKSDVLIFFFIVVSFVIKVLFDLQQFFVISYFILSFRSIYNMFKSLLFNDNKDENNVDTYNNDHKNTNDIDDEYYSKNDKNDNNDIITVI